MTYPKCCILIDDDPNDQLVSSLAKAHFSRPIFCVSMNNGLDALRELEQDAVTPDFIFPDLSNKTRNLGAVAFITKPYFMADPGMRLNDFF
ncbi:MAG: hypothetical protein WEB30_18335 [Cyclobacteriaceae bacterium]